MTDVIFAKPRYEYGSYVDLYNLIQLSGYPTVYFDEIDPNSDNTYIMTILNGENKDGWVNPKARIILYDLEWHQESPQIPGVVEVWAADAWYAKMIGAKYVPLGSHPGLMMTSAHIPFIYDVATMMYTWGRREAMVGQLKAVGVSIAPKAWDSTRDMLLHQSRYMLHVHQHDWARTIAPQRFALAAAYGMPMISEAVEDMGIFKDAQIIFAPFDDLCAVVKGELVDPRMVVENGQSLYQLLCVDRIFHKNIEAAL